jgi:hypothetical protein
MAGLNLDESDGARNMSAEAKNAVQGKRGCLADSAEGGQWGT